MSVIERHSDRNASSMGLTNILVGELMGQTHSLRLVPDRFAINDGNSELFNNRLVDRIALWTS